MTRYLFDPSTVIVPAEMKQITEWLRSLGIDPGMVPTGAELVLDGNVLTVEVHTVDARGRKYVAGDGEVARAWVTVELTGPLPTFASLEECPA